MPMPTLTEAPDVVSCILGFLDPFAAIKILMCSKRFQKLGVDCKHIARILEDVRNDEVLARRAVGNDGMFLRSVAPALRGKGTIILVAVQNNAAAFRFVPDDVRNDAKLTRQLLRVQSSVLLELHDDLRYNIAFVTSVVGQNGLALEYAPEEMRDNEKVVMSATKNCGPAFRHASLR